MRVHRFQCVACLSLPLAIAVTTGSRDARAQTPWADAEVGIGRVSLPQAFDDFVPTKLDPALGLGAGVRFSSWSVGLGAHFVPTSTFKFYEGALEVAFRPSVDRWEPYVGVHAGYATLSMQSLDIPGLEPEGGSVQIPLPNPHGPDLGLAAGVDYRVTSLLVLGVGVEGEALFLSAPAAYFTLGQGQPPALAQYAHSGVGSALVATVRAGIEFGP